MNFLQLAQAVKRESGLTGGGPVSLATATGDDLRLFDWVAWAWRDIDLMHEDWKWRRGAGQATTAASMVLTGSTSFGLADFGSWLHESREYKVTAYRTALGQQTEAPIYFAPYDAFRAKFIVGTHAPGPLQYWTISPDDELLVGPTPSEDHRVRADYIRTHVPLTADAQAPLLPERFHPLIQWHALREYGGFDAASEVWQRADRNLNSSMPMLRQACRPTMRWARRPLA